MADAATIESRAGSIRSRFLELVRAAPPEAGAIAGFLNELDSEQRVEAISALAGPGLQRRLYRAASAAEPVTIDDLVPSSTPPLHEVVFEGKNSLPAFTRFQKRFCRAPGAPELWGYNHQTLQWLTGPGYFVARNDDAHGVALDYRTIPPQAIAEWPDLRGNERGLSRFVFKDLVDYLRRVSRDVFVGSAHRRGKELGNYFVISRVP